MNQDTINPNIIKKLEDLEKYLVANNIEFFVNSDGLVIEIEENMFHIVDGYSYQNIFPRNHSTSRFVRY